MSENDSHHEQEGERPAASITANALSIWHAVWVGVGTCITIGTIIYSGVQSVHNDISSIRQDEATLALRVSNLEEKDRFYDRLVDTRNQQIMDIKGDVSAIKAYLEDSRAARQAAPDPYGRK